MRETYAVQQCWSSRANLFDHLVGALLKDRRHVEADRLGGFEIDHQFELDWGLRVLSRM